MNEFSRTIQIRWSDPDPNFHIRHSVFYDWGAYARIEFFNEFGLTSQVMQELQIGPILFREECVFKKEIRPGYEIKMDVRLLRSRKDFSRWSFQHHFTKGDGTLCAVLTVDGAWLDVVKRKLASPPEKVNEIFNKMQKGEGFQWVD